MYMRRWEEYREAYAAYRIILRDFYPIDERRWPLRVPDLRHTARLPAESANNRSGGVKTRTETFRPQW